tara:strand:+ start:856 stop:1296 length:441 start_codon:yes stop_codon:yes gene_type:complete
MKTLSNIAKKILGGTFSYDNYMQQLKNRGLSSSSYGNTNLSSNYNFTRPSVISNTSSSSILRPTIGSSPTSVGSSSSSVVRDSVKKCEETTKLLCPDNRYLTGIIIILVLAITGLCIWFFILREDDKYVVYNNKKEENKAKRIKKI